MIGPVVRGFGRGSKQLGIPTANLDAEAQGGIVSDLAAGIYFGWASVGTSPEVYKMVTSIGWCVAQWGGGRAPLVGVWREGARTFHAE